MATADLPFTVEVIRSARRTRSVGAQMKGSVLRITVPSWMTRAQEADAVAKMTARFRRSISAERIDLVERARVLARRFGLPTPDIIEWRHSMNTLWGTCQHTTRTVHLSSRLAAFPDWVIDYVIVHELAHLVIDGHGHEFWELVHRYPKSERAIGYLIAMSGDDDTH